MFLCSWPHSYSTPFWGCSRWTKSPILRSVRALLSLRLISREIIFEVSNLCDHYPPRPTSQTDVGYRQTDGQTDDLQSQDRALHYSASGGKNKNTVAYHRIGLGNVIFLMLICFSVHMTRLHLNVQFRKINSTASKQNQNNVNRTDMYNICYRILYHAHQRYSSVVSIKTKHAKAQHIKITHLQKNYSKKMFNIKNDTTALC